MAVKVDNLDDVINQLAKMEKAVELEIIREARKRFRSVMRKLVPTAKKASPKDTGNLIKNVKVKSRSKRGVSTVKVDWQVPYAGPLNFKKGQSAEKFASELWQKEKDSLDQKGAAIVKEVFKDVLKKHGVKVENK
jgi:hypothetical protein